MIGLKYIHHNNIFHRDIKPENIFICDDGTVKIIDFGCSFKIKVLDKETDKLQIGTPHYMAPELVKQKRYNHKVDIWSVGVMLYEMCVGQDPFNDKATEDIYKNIKEAKPDYSLIPEKFKWFKELIKKMLIKETGIINKYKDKKQKEVTKTDKKEIRPEAEELLKEDLLIETFKNYEYRHSIFFEIIEEKINNIQETCPFCGQNYLKIEEGK